MMLIVRIVLIIVRIITTVMIILTILSMMNKTMIITMITIRCRYNNNHINNTNYDNMWALVPLIIYMCIHVYAYIYI